MALTEQQITNLPVMPTDTKAVAGKDTLLYIAISQNPLEWLLFGGQKNSPVSEKADSLDGSDKSSGGWAKKIPGMKSWSIDYDGLYVLNDKAVDIARTQFRNDQSVYIRIEYPDGSYRQGWAFITAMSDSNASDAIHTLKITFEGYGSISDLITVASAAIATPTIAVTKGSAVAKSVAVTPADVTVRGVVDATGMALVYGTDYTYANGSLTFTAAYLGSLTPGSYAITAKFATISITITITVSNT